MSEVLCTTCRQATKLVCSTKECRVCARDICRVLPAADRTRAMATTCLCPGSPCGRCRARLPVGPPGTTAPTNGLTGCRVRSAYCLRGFGTPPLRHSDNTLAPTPTRDYAPSLRSPWRAAKAQKSSQICLGNWSQQSKSRSKVICRNKFTRL